ncbi:hypothetical protein [Nocardia sp. NPDC050412]
MIRTDDARISTTRPDATNAALTGREKIRSGGRTWNDQDHVAATSTSD